MKEKEIVKVEVPEIEVVTTTITIVGDTPLLIHKFSEKAKKSILDKQMKKPKKANEVKKPFEEFIQSLHWITPMPDTDGRTDDELKEEFETLIKAGARFGFPTTGIKQSAISGMYRAGLSKNKVSLQGAFHIKGELAEIKGELHMREDYVKIPSTGTADIVYRGEYKEGWESDIVVVYDKNAISIEQIVQMLNYGGFSVGIGEWRVERGGNFGMFHCK